MGTFPPEWWWELLKWIIARKGRKTTCDSWCTTKPWIFQLSVLEGVRYLYLAQELSIRGIALWFRYWDMTYRHSWHTARVIPLLWYGNHMYLVFPLHKMDVRVPDHSDSGEDLTTRMKVLSCYEKEGIGVRMCAYVNAIVWQGSGESWSLENDLKNPWWASKSPSLNRALRIIWSLGNLGEACGACLRWKAPELSVSEILKLQSLLCSLRAPRLYLALQWAVVWAGRSSGVYRRAALMAGFYQEPQKQGLVPESRAFFTDTHRTSFFSGHRVGSNSVSYWKLSVSRK